MKISTKQSVLFALAYATYCVVLSLLFSPFEFIGLDNTLVTLLLFAPGIFVLQFTLGRLLSHKLSLFGYHLSYSIGTYLIPSIAALSVMFIYGTEGQYDLFLFMSTFLIIPLLPLAVYVLWMVFQDLKTRVIISAEKVSDASNTVEKIFRIKNDKGRVIVEILVNQIITFEANDNYVVTYYVDDSGALQKSMQRISLKKIEELLIDIEANFIRVHKSYMINPGFVAAVKGRSQAYKLQMQFFKTEIPVSRSFDISSLDK